MSLAREYRVFLRLVFRSPLTLFVACGMTFPASLLLLVGAGIDGLDFLYARQARLWHVLSALLPTLSVACLLLVAEHVRGERSVWPRGGGERLGVVLCAVLCLLLTELPFVVQARRQPFPAGLDSALGVAHWYTKAVVVCVLVGLVVALLYAGLFGIHVRLIRWLARGHSQEESSQGQVSDEELLRYQRLRSQLDLFLYLLASLDGLAVLTLGALRNLLREVAPAKPDVMPAASVMAFGLYFTALLAGAYLPARATLANVGESLARRLVRPSPAASADWRAWSEEQQAVRSWLGLQGSALADLQQGFSVLVPFLASLSALLLGPLNP